MALIVSNLSDMTSREYTDTPQMDSEHAARDRSVVLKVHAGLPPLLTSLTTTNARRQIPINQKNRQSYGGGRLKTYDSPFVVSTILDQS